MIPVAGKPPEVALSKLFYWQKVRLPSMEMFGKLLADLNLTK